MKKNTNPIPTHSQWGQLRLASYSHSEWLIFRTAPILQVRYINNSCTSPFFPPYRIILLLFAPVPSQFVDETLSYSNSNRWDAWKSCGSRESCWISKKNVTLFASWSLEFCSYFFSPCSYKWGKYLLLPFRKCMGKQTPVSSGALRNDPTMSCLCNQREHGLFFCSVSWSPFLKCQWVLTAPF